VDTRNVQVKLRSIDCDIGVVQVDDDGDVRTVLLHSECGKALSSSGRLERGAKLQQHKDKPPVIVEPDKAPCFRGAFKFTIGRLCFSVKSKVCASESEAAMTDACLPCAGVWSPWRGLRVTRMTALCLSRHLHLVHPEASASEMEAATLQGLLWRYAPVIPGFVRPAATGIIHRGWPLVLISLIKEFKQPAELQTHLLGV
jgi:hypothetical protein